MGKSAPSGPNATAVDQEIGTQETANLQSALESTQLSDVNQNTPYGNETYKVTGTNSDGTPQYTLTSTLSQPEQQLLNQQQSGQISEAKLANSMQGDIAGNLTLSNQQLNQLPGITGSVNQAGTGTTQSAIQAAQNAAYGAQTQYLNPQFAQANEALTNQLANEGVTQGSQAYNTAMQNLGLQQTQAYQSAQDAAVTAGQNEQNTLFGQGVTSSNLQNTADQQQLSQDLTLQQEPLNEFSALMSGTQVTNPSFQSTNSQQVAPTNTTDIYNSNYAQELAAYNANQSGINNLFGLAGSLGSASILSSDRRLKCEIVKLGTLHSGIPFYQFEYTAQPGVLYVGVMADEVMPIMPEAVVIRDDGYMAVNYGLLK